VTCELVTANLLTLLLMSPEVVGVWRRST